MHAISLNIYITLSYSFDTRYKGGHQTIKTLTREK